MVETPSQPRSHHEMSKATDYKRAITTARQTMPKLSIQVGNDFFSAWVDEYGDLNLKGEPDMLNATQIIKLANWLLETFEEQKP
jgi:hypothetical protein